MQRSKAGEPYCDHFSLELLRSDTYHHDGQIKDEVMLRIVLAEQMYSQGGCRCTDCHDPHSWKLETSWQRDLQTSCQPARRWEIRCTLAPSSTAVGSEGAQCVKLSTCHNTTYIGRSIPTAGPQFPRGHVLDLSLELKTPNAVAAVVTSRITQINVALGKPRRSETVPDCVLTPPPSKGDDSVAEGRFRVTTWCDDGNAKKLYGESRENAHRTLPEALAGPRSDDRETFRRWLAARCYDLIAGAGSGAGVGGRRMAHARDRSRPARSTNWCNAVSASCGSRRRPVCRENKESPSKQDVHPGAVAPDLARDRRRAIGSSRKRGGR